MSLKTHQTRFLNPASFIHGFSNKNIAFQQIILRIPVPTYFIDWLEILSGEDSRKTLKAITGNDVKVRFVTTETSRNHGYRLKNSPEESLRQEYPLSGETGILDMSLFLFLQNKTPLPYPHTPLITYVVGEITDLLYAASRPLLNTPLKPLNPLFIYIEGWIWEKLISARNPHAFENGNRPGLDCAMSPSDVYA